jgi:hypothetical protein
LPCLASRLFGALQPFLQPFEGNRAVTSRAARQGLGEGPEGPPGSLRPAVCQRRPWKGAAFASTSSAVWPAEHSAAPDVSFTAIESRGPPQQPLAAVRPTSRRPSITRTMIVTISAEDRKALQQFVKARFESLESLVEQQIARTRNWLSSQLC